MDKQKTEAASLVPLTLKNPETGIETTVYVDNAAWKKEQDFYNYTTYIYWKYFSPQGSQETIAPEDEFEQWIERGKPEPKLFDRA